MNASLDKALNKLAKWRAVFAGWQLGTRADTDPECQAVRDHREVTLFLRAEVNALAAVLAEKDPTFMQRFEHHLEVEADILSKSYEGKFPGMKATDYGISFSPEAAKTMRGWRP